MRVGRHQGRERDAGGFLLSPHHQSGRSRGQFRGRSQAAAGKPVAPLHGPDQSRSSVPTAWTGETDARHPNHLAVRRFHTAAWTPAFLAILIVLGCSSTRANRAAPALPVSPAHFVDGEWSFRADSSATSGLWKLGREDDASVKYERMTDSLAYTVTLSEHGARISIAGANGTFVGTRSKVTQKGVAYSLTEWAGGQFVVCPGRRSLRAELTIFGSGVPVIGSVRGALVPKP